MAVPVPVQDLNRFSGGSGSGSEGFLPTGPVLGYLDRPVHNTGTTPEADKQGQVREFLDELLQRSRLWQGLVSALLDKRILGVVGLPLPTKKPECGHKSCGVTGAGIWNVNYKQGCISEEIHLGLAVKYP